MQRVILYDGNCGLCRGAMGWIRARDGNQLFRFEALGGQYAVGTLKKHGRDPEGFDSVALLLNVGEPSERLLEGTDAILSILRELGGIWRLLAALRILPRPLREAGYRVIARNRYRIGGSGGP